MRDEGAGAPDPAGAVVLEVDGLSIALPPGAERELAVEDVRVALRAGEILCVVGESGSGKSMWANAVMGLLPERVAPSAGRLVFRGEDLLGLDAAGLRRLRGSRIAMVFQEPMTALNPLMRVADQIAEVFEAHGELAPAARRERSLALLAEVGMPDPPRAARAYPHQLSGGQRQRVMIAMALALEPVLLICDEPTTALDVTTQAQILALIRRLQTERGTSVLFVTHDFGVVAEIADRVVVMQHGRVVESGAAAAVLDAPKHPYTRALVDAIPDGRAAAADASPAVPDAAAGAGDAPPLRVVGLSRTFRSGGGWRAGGARVVRALDDVSFELARGETLGVVGESGSGKSTLARCLVRLEVPDAGRVELDGTDIAPLEGAPLRAARRRIQMVFQDPYASLNPRARVRRTLTEGAMAHGLTRGEADARASRLLGLVGLDDGALGRYPHEFSGGQRQRIGIARALMLEPGILVADEAVSALDVSVQRQVLELFASLKAELGLSLVFVTHDLRVAASICDRIAVMQAGRIVEIGPARDVFEAPAEDYTRELLAAIPGARSETRAAAREDAPGTPGAGVEGAAAVPAP